MSGRYSSSRPEYEEPPHQYEGHRLEEQLILRMPRNKAADVHTHATPTILIATTLPHPPSTLRT